MDKKKPEIAKSAKKTARIKIEESLNVHLSTLTAEFGPASKKLKKEIAKGAKKMAKKLAKELTFAKAAETEKPVKSAPAAEKPTGKAQAVKPAAPAKPAAAKVAPAKAEKTTE